MKIKRYKHARKILSLYKTHFGLRQPYQIIGENNYYCVECNDIIIHNTIIIVDGTFCQAALTGKIQLKQQLTKYLGGQIQLG